MWNKKTFPLFPRGVGGCIRNLPQSQFYFLFQVVVLLTVFCTRINAYKGLHNITISDIEENEGILSTESTNISTYHNSSTSSLRLFEESSSKTRRKRSVVHLFNMVVCATGCNPLTYKGYGCYCGFLGSGYPVDGIDRCCWMHDRCYDATGCPTFSEYFIPYYWKCYRGHLPICAVTHGHWGGSGSCAQRLCECDRALSKCLRRFPCPSSKAVCTSSPFRLVQNIFMIF